TSRGRIWTALIFIFSLRRFSVELAERRANFLFLIFTQHRQSDISAWRIAGDTVAKRVCVAYGRVIDCQDYIATTNAGAFGGARRPYGIYDHASGFRHSQAGSQIRRHATYYDSELAATHFPALHELVHHGAGHVRRNGESNSNVATTHSRYNLRINANQFAHRVD